MNALKKYIAEFIGTFILVFMGCGTEDFLYVLNQNVHKRLEEMGVSTVYREVPGHMHNWDFWDLEIQRILDWMFPVNA